MFYLCQRFTTFKRRISSTGRFPHYGAYYKIFFRRLTSILRVMRCCWPRAGHESISDRLAVGKPCKNIPGLHSSHPLLLGDNDKGVTPNVPTSVVHLDPISYKLLPVSAFVLPPPMSWKSFAPEYSAVGSKPVCGTVAQLENCDNEVSHNSPY